MSSRAPSSTLSQQLRHASLRFPMKGVADQPDLQCRGMTSARGGRLNLWCWIHLACSRFLVKVHAHRHYPRQCLSRPQVFYGVGFLFCFPPWASPGLALALGLAFALTLDNPYREAAAATCVGSCRPAWYCWASEWIWRQCCEWATWPLVRGRDHLRHLHLGYSAREALEINPETSLLISAGTAICGGSAIAAVGRRWTRTAARCPSPWARCSC